MWWSHLHPSGGVSVLLTNTIERTRSNIRGLGPRWWKPKHLYIRTFWGISNVRLERAFGLLECELGRKREKSRTALVNSPKAKGLSVPQDSSPTSYHPLHFSISPLLHPPYPQAYPQTTMFKPTQTYDQVAAAELQAELDEWHEEPIESVESRSHQVNLHRRPGFYKKALLGSITVNAVLLMVCGWLYLKLRV